MCKQIKQITLFRRNLVPEFDIKELEALLLDNWKIEAVIGTANNIIILSK